MTQTPQLTIRPLRADDRPDWDRLWTAYLTFYETVLPPEVYDASFKRLLTPGYNEFKGLIAEQNGTPVGLTHYVFHREMWSVEDICYLEDLFVTPDLRGGGVGRALINGVRDAAAEAGIPTVYWHTQEFNATARKLYDKLAVLTPFLKYETPSRR